LKSNTRYTNPLDVNPGNAGTMTPALASVSVKRVDHTVEGTPTDLAQDEGQPLVEQLSGPQADPQNIVEGHVVPQANPE